MAELGTYSDNIRFSYAVTNLSLNIQLYATLGEEILYNFCRERNYIRANFQRVAYTIGILHCTKLGDDSVL